MVHVPHRMYDHDYSTTTTQVMHPHRLSIVPEEINVPTGPPILDFSGQYPINLCQNHLTDMIAFYGNNKFEKDLLVARVRQACLEKGFFQIINHNVPAQLQQAIFEQSKDFFSLPTEEKTKLDKGQFLCKQDVCAV